jgi:hypothetical protein
VPTRYADVFQSLKRVLAEQRSRLAVSVNTTREYTLVTKSPSPYPQHTGKPLWFGAVKVGKAYVSYHLVALYMNPALSKTVSVGLKRRMQGKACFNFKVPPEPELLGELKRLTASAVDDWARQNLL